MTRDLDDTGPCPLADRCDTCGGDQDLRVATAQTPVGVFCLTLCGPCAHDGQRLPVLSILAAVERSLAHCQHLGIDADQMSALMLKEQLDG